MEREGDMERARTKEVERMNNVTQRQRGGQRDKVTKCVITQGFMLRTASSEILARCFTSSDRFGEFHLDTGAGDRFATLIRSENEERYMVRRGSDPSCCQFFWSGECTARRCDVGLSDSLGRRVGSKATYASDSSVLLRSWSQDC